MSEEVQEGENVEDTPGAEDSEDSTIPEEDRRRIAEHALNENHHWDFGADTAEEILEEINVILESPETEMKEGRDGRRAYYEESSNTLIIHNPNEDDRGTAYKPEGGRRAFEKWN